MTYHRLILIAHLVATMSSTSTADADGSTQGVSNPVLQQLHVIARHGEDTKNHAEFAESSVNTLTPIGRYAKCFLEFRAIHPVVCLPGFAIQFRILLHSIEVATKEVFSKLYEFCFFCSIVWCNYEFPD